MGIFTYGPFGNRPLQIVFLSVVINICIDIQILDDCINGIDIVALQLLFALWITHRDNQILDNGCLCICTFEGNSCNKLWHIIFPVPCCGIAVSCYLINIITIFVFLCCSLILLNIFFDILISRLIGKDSCIGIVIDELPHYFCYFVVLHRRRDVQLDFGCRSHQFYRNILFRILGDGILTLAAHQEFLVVYHGSWLPDVIILLGTGKEFLQILTLEIFLCIGYCIVRISIIHIKMECRFPVARTQFLCFVLCRGVEQTVYSAFAGCWFEHLKVKRRQSFFMKILFFLHSCGLQVVDHGSHAQLLCSRTVFQFVFS